MSDEARDLEELIRTSLPSFSAPDSLRTFARTEALRELAPSPSRTWLRAAMAAGLVLTFVAGWASRSLLDSPNRAEPASLTTAVVDAHVRALMSGHLTDVISSDQHTVKPWFAGKVPLAPAVPELSSAGFPLIGGRVETVAEHPAAALVYGRARHFITLYIWTTPAPDRQAEPHSYHGYSVVHWTRAGLAYWAVSDVNPADLAAFTRLYTESLPTTYP